MATLTTQLEQLENAQLVRRAPDEELAYLFKHNLTQETAYQSLLVKRRREIHRRVAQALEQLFPAQLDENAALLAQHYAEVGDDAKTFEYATRAGNVAARRYAHREAVDSYDRALNAARGFAPPPDELKHLYLARGRTLELSGQYDAALANYREMEALGDARGQPPLKLAGLMARATINSIPSSVYDPALAQVLSDQALELARQIGDAAAEAKILWNLMLMNSRGEWHPRQAIEYGEQSLALARKLNLREQLAYTLNDLSTPYAFTGQPARALTLEREAREMWIEMQDVRMLSSNYAYAVMTRMTIGDFQDAVASSREAFRLSESIGDTWGMAFSLTWVGPAYLQLGEVGEAIRIMEQAIVLGNQANFIAPAVITRSDLARTYAELGALERALDEVKLAVAKIPPRYNIIRVWGMSILAHLYVMAGLLDQADALIAEFSRKPAPDDSTPFVIYIPSVEIELALARGEDARAWELAHQLIDSLKRLGLHQFVIDAYLLQTEALRRLGRLDEAQAALDEGLALAQASGARWSEWKVLAALGSIEHARGRTDEAARLRAAARALIESLAARTPEEFRESFLNLPQVRQVVEARV